MSMREVHLEIRESPEQVAADCIKFNVESKLTDEGRGAFQVFSLKGETNNLHLALQMLYGMDEETATTAVYSATIVT